MKKKVVAVCATVALAAVAFGGATLAYFTDHDQVKNNFTIGDIDIDLYEYADLDGDGKLEEQKFQEYLNYSNIMPGDEMAKVPVIENESDTNAAYVRVAVVMNNVQAINDAIDAVYEAKGYSEEQIQAVYDTVFDGWGMSYTKRNVDGNNDRRLWMDERTSGVEGVEILFDGQIDMYCNVGGASNMFDVKNTFKSEFDTNEEGFDYEGKGYYAGATKADERIYVFYLKMDKGTKYSLFNGLNAPADFAKSTGIVGLHVTDVNQMAMFQDLKIGIYADAIQVDNFDKAQDAFNALQTAHPLGWWNNN